jgi:hypothetical protein
MPSKVIDRRRGAEPPKNPSGRDILIVLGTDNARYVRAGSGSSITAANRSIIVPVSPDKEISDMRSRCPSAAMMFSSASADTENRGKCAFMEIGKDGQIFRRFLVGVLAVQETRKSRRRGDAKMMCRHLRDTCAKFCHLHRYGIQGIGSLRMIPNDTHL